MNKFIAQICEFCSFLAFFQNDFFFLYDLRQETHSIGLQRRGNSFVNFLESNGLKKVKI